MAALKPRRIGLGPRPVRDPGAEAWIRGDEGVDAAPCKAEIYSARMTVDVTPQLRGRIKVIAFERGITVAGMLRDLLEREYGGEAGEDG